MFFRKLLNDASVQYSNIEYIQENPCDVCFPEIIMINRRELIAGITGGVVSAGLFKSVEINSDNVLNTSVTEVVKTYSGVSATVKDGVVTLTGNIKREQLPNLIKSVQELKPKKVENKLIIK